MTPPAATSTPPAAVAVADEPLVRCSDIEREQCGARLHAAAGEGRLTLDEVTSRLDAVYAARYRHELHAVTNDLPSPTQRSGWQGIAVLVWHQLLADLAVLVGRAPARSARHRAVLAAVAALTAIVVIGSTVLLIVHGIVGDETEHRFGDLAPHD